ncbi:MAG: HesA/MoeB/ThiF family protein [Blastocatellia bacterium]
MSSNAFYHERLRRGPEAMRRVAEFPVMVCGAGALGANIAEGLARQGFARLRVIDRDRIEERNLSMQPYFVSEIGGLKAKMLANSIYRAVGVAVDARTDELTSGNTAKLLDGSGLVIDAFDNSVARAAVKEHCQARAVPCLHAGLANDYAEVIWNEVYRIPSAANDDVCDYPLARNLAILTAAVASEVSLRFAIEGKQENYTITLGDFAVRRFEP